MIVPGTSVNVYMNLDDIGLFKKRKANEGLSQRDRAEQIRDAFGHCMSEALSHRHCVMPGLCANSEVLSCGHLTVHESAVVTADSPHPKLVVDYQNFTGRGVPLTGRARTQIDGRLRAIGTLVYRHEHPLILGSLPGDAYVKMLQKTRFPASSKAMPKAKHKNRGALAWLFG